MIKQIKNKKIIERDGNETKAQHVETYIFIES